SLEVVEMRFSVIVVLLSLIGCTHAIILTGTVVCEKTIANSTVTALLIIGTMKDDKFHENGQHKMELTPPFWSEYLLRVETTKSWMFQDEVTVVIKVTHNCHKTTAGVLGCYVIRNKSDYTVVRTHIVLDDRDSDPKKEFNQLPKHEECHNVP
ncbi:hypothetical protein PFISCL1PPCAC_28819, partial [Pristionchus fissidentatus]